MLNVKRFYLSAAVLSLLLPMTAKCASLTVVPGRQPYTSETTGHLVVWLNNSFSDGDFTFKAAFKDVVIVREQPVKTQQRQIFEFNLDQLPQGDNDVVCSVTQKGVENEPVVAHLTIRRVPPADHVTKVDFIRRGLVVDDQPFFPVGFYCDSNFKLSLPETEVLHGFNMISPYRAGLAAENEKDKKKTMEFLDLCASIGMKVVYDLRPIAEQKNSEEKFARLKAELDLVAHHPAILCWIISDEPADKQLDPVPLIETYKFLKEHDPYHPVTMVFCHYVLMHKYMDAMDFVLLDYYPIPNHPVIRVDEMLDLTRDAIGPFVPLWYVPQAFGGSWTWSREPSSRELQVMTYLSLIDGVSGINYFIRRPEIENPNSPLLWAACRRMAAETAQLAPALLSALPWPAVECSFDTARVTAREHDGYYTIIAANTESQPAIMTVQLKNSDYTGPADVLFEDRQVKVADGTLEDMIDAFGTRVYRFRSENYVPADIQIDPKNVVVNPSFEESVNPGTPTGSCPGNSQNCSTLTIDPWKSRHGLQSIRVIAPVKGSAVRYSTSPIPLEKGRLYRLSIWARAEKEGQTFKVYGDRFNGTFELTTEWKEYTIEATPKRSSTREVGIHVQFEGTGAAWFDLLQVVPIEEKQE